MTNKLKSKAAIAAGAIGSAAITAALLYCSKRKERKRPDTPGTIPSGEKPETD